MEVIENNNKENNFQIQIVSDLHLEFDKDVFKIPQSAPYLAILGDCCVFDEEGTKKYDEFLKKHFQKFKKILIIMGNHVI